jgi:hypothetical protein
MDIVSVIHISLCSIIVFSDQNVERNYSAWIVLLQFNR